MTTDARQSDSRATEHPAVTGSSRPEACSPGRQRGLRSAGQATAPPPTLDAETTSLIDAVVKRLPEEDRAKVRAELTREVAEVPAADLDKVTG